MNKLKPNFFSAPILSNQKIGKNYFCLKVKTPQNIDQVEPGQFAMLRGKWNYDPLLPRPLSIARAEKFQLDFIYEVRGRGTHLLSLMQPPREIEILAPLGNSFPPPENSLPLLLAGGIGFPPLYFYQQKYGGKLLAGFQTNPELDLFSDKIIATDDGSLGFKGNVLQLLESCTEINNYSTIMACGPRIMLKQLKNRCSPLQCNLFLSLEEKMACGTGLCHGCAVKSRQNDYFKICTDGPIFKSSDVNLEE
ncbi:MAG: dihydroorotate dehydrogenase electron transfer subunit [Deltaproteobacteria bacterium]|jgi:dihydroorotate dehydrogenase electron transfer subunit|nr:dihydroorotate dehydrogenase electron transfer subunit [Deltaproteobacteria bacterium]